MHLISPYQDLSKKFTSKVTLSKIRNGLVKVTFPSPFQYLNGSLSKPLSSKIGKSAIPTYRYVWMIFLVDLNDQGVSINVFK